MRAPISVLCLGLVLGACAAGEGTEESSTFGLPTTMTMASASGDGDGDGETSSGEGDGDPGDGDPGDGDPGDGDPGEGVCGNGVKENGEECDGMDLGGADCSTFNFEEGILVCADDCTLFTNACSTCGDGQIAPTEACDGNNLGGLTCTDLGYAGGTLTCAGDCKSVIESGCMAAPSCGNGNIDAGEMCDGNNLNGQNCMSLGYDMGVLTCTQGCQFDDSDCEVAPDQCVPLLGACNVLINDCCAGLMCTLVCLPE